MVLNFEGASEMKFRRKLIFGVDLQGLLIGIVLGYLILIQHTLAVEPPEGVLALREGGYVFADYPDVFDGFGREGLTIDVWFYITHVPSDWKESRVLIDKPQSYLIAIRGRKPTVDQEVVGFVEYKVYTRSGHIHPFPSVWLFAKNSPLNRWVHLAYQIRGDGPVQVATFFDGEGIGTGSTNTTAGYLASSDPLFVGGREGHKSVKGRIDEIRISRGWRYTPNQPINPPREFVTDKYTLALWHFDEGPWAPHYADASGNGYTLSAAGTLPVEQSDKIATMWGRLKSDSAPAHPE